jgi:hypothetical protein
MAALSRFQEHSQSRHLADYVDIRVFENNRLFQRRRVWLQQQTLSHGNAPAHAISVAMFQEIDGPVQFATPPANGYLPPALVDEQQRSRPQDRIHRPILQPDESIP